MTRTFTFSLLLLTLVLSAYTTPITKGAQITFDKDVHDYGVVEYAGNGTCEFTVTNTGDQPLLIQEAKASCGCTVPSYPKEPIAPGASATITVKYNTKRPGSINKSIRIVSNAVNEQEKVIYIKGRVEQQPVQDTQTGSTTNTVVPSKG
jgi:hypothetical protein